MTDKVTPRSFNLSVTFTNVLGPPGLTLHKGPRFDYYLHAPQGVSEAEFDTAIDSLVEQLRQELKAVSRGGKAETHRSFLLKPQKMKGNLNAKSLVD